MQHDTMRAADVLAQIKDDHIDAWAEDSTSPIPRLVTAVEAALKRADEWAAEANRIDGLFADEPDPQVRATGSMRAHAFESCAAKLRADIRTALTGEEG
jgi:hypothetical protein